MNILFMMELVERKVVISRVEFIQKIVRLYEVNMPDLELDHISIPESWNTAEFRERVATSILHPQIFTMHVTVVFRGKAGDTHSATYPIPDNLKGSDR